MADQVILKHIREAIGSTHLNELEIELRLNRHLDAAAFRRLDERLATATWESTQDKVSTDRTVGDVRVTDNTTAIRKRRVFMTDVGHFRVVTSQEQEVPLPGASVSGFQRVKHRRERCFWGWKLALTVVNPDEPHPGYEVELELDWLFLVRRPYDLLAKAGACLMTDIVQILDG